MDKHYKCLISILRNNRIDPPGVNLYGIRGPIVIIITNNDKEVQKQWRINTKNVQSVENTTGQQ